MRTIKQVMRRESGMSLVELMVSMTILMIVSGVVMSGIFGLTRINQTTSNRAEMHSGVRNATELIQQEVGQAGRLTLPANVTVTGAVGLSGAAQTVNVSSATSMFTGEKLVIGTGDLEETVTLTNVNPDTPSITGIFTKAHAAGESVTVRGGFSSGIVPPGGTGSSGSLLKIVGDIHGTGELVYVEYWCDIAAATAANPGRLYRNSMAWNRALPKPAPTVDQILVQNVLPNPIDPNSGQPTPCFTYLTKVVNGKTYVVGVAVTLTVQTQGRDNVTGDFQTETKALLNVSPRNVFNVWEMASLDITNRVQDLPGATQALIP